MMKWILASSLLFATMAPLCGDVSELSPDSLSLSQGPKLPQEGPRLGINNRPLAKINGKVITLTDVIKKMDLFLFDYDPNFNPSPMERYQFYMSRWQTTLDEMIGNELVLLDAEQKEIKISDGEVREELEGRFGPYTMISLDKVGLSLEEARTYIRNELTIQQLIGMKVHAKAFQLVTPQLIKGAYEEYLAKNPSQENWTYQVLSVRGKEKTVCEAIAKDVYQVLKEKGLSLSEAAHEVEEGLEGISISVSEDFAGQTTKLSKQHYSVLQNLEPQTISEPVSQVSRHDNSTVVRVFHLKEKEHIEPTSFDEMHDKLKNELLYKTSDKEKDDYIKALKKRFGYDHHDPKFDLPEDYHPFLLL